MLKEGFGSRTEFIKQARKDNPRLLYVRTFIRQDNGNSMISTIISDNGKIIFKKIHETVENTQTGAYDVTLSERGIIQRNVTSEKYVNVIKKCLPGTGVVGPITNTLIKTEEKQKDKEVKLKELFSSAGGKGIESYDISA